MPAATDDDVDTDPTWQRLEDQIAHAGRSSLRARQTYGRLKLTEIVFVALILFLAGFQERLAVWLQGPDFVPATLIALLAVGVIVVECMLHLDQHQQRWLRQRSIHHALQREKYLFLAGAGHYAHTDDLRARLAERIEELISRDSDPTGGLPRS
jgi:hypothetical protein